MTGPTNAELQQQLAQRDQELAEAREQLAALRQHAVTDDDQGPGPQPARGIPPVGKVTRDERFGGGYVLVVDVDQDAVTVARLPEVHQVGRHALEPEPEA